MILKKIFLVDGQCRFWKNNMRNVRKHRYITLLTTEARSYLVSEPHYHAKKKKSENLLAIEMKRHRYL